LLRDTSGRKLVDLSHYSVAELIDGVDVLHEISNGN